MTIDETLLKLNSPLSVKRLSVKNRIIRSATNDYRGNLDGTLSEEQLEIYKALSVGGTGLIITGNFYACESGRVYEDQPGLCGEKQGELLKLMTGTVHESGSAIIAQISHAGRKSKLERELTLRYETPSDIPKSELQAICRHFADAALAAKSNGFDGVQLHCAHGYLLTDFLDPVINDRTDEYGGSVSGRMKFPLEIIEAIKNACGQDYPLLIKLAATIESKSLDGAYADMFCDYLKLFEDAGVHAAEISGANLASYKRRDHNYFEPQLVSARKHVSMPLILTGGIRTLWDVRSAFEDGADFVGFSRPFIVEPDFAESLLQSGKSSKCQSCNACYSLKERGGKRCILESSSKSSAQN